MLANENLSQFTGTEHYHRWSPLFPNYVLTDGAKYVADHGGGCGAYWLMDAIASYWNEILRHRDARLRDMQFWQLKVKIKDGTAILTCRADSDCKPAFTQRFDTDFDLPEIDLWVEPQDNLWVILLPSEH